MVLHLPLALILRANWLLFRYASLSGEAMGWTASITQPPVAILALPPHCQSLILIQRYSAAQVRYSALAAYPECLDTLVCEQFIHISKGEA